MKQFLKYNKMKALRCFLELRQWPIGMKDHLTVHEKGFSNESI